MFALVNSAKGLLKKNESAGPPSGWAFWATGKLTSSLVLLMALLLAGGWLVGNPIECTPSRDLPTSLLHTHCWITSTYSVVAGYPGLNKLQVPSPGVVPSGGVLMGDSLRHHTYYQWVPFFLVLQAVLFYMPRWFWKHWEGGKIHALMMDLEVGICSEVEKKQKKKLLLDYLWENLRYHNWWCYRYYFCELLSLVNVVGQMFLMNRFFDGAFLTFGIDVLTFLESDQEERVDPMIFIFPRMTKCTFYKYGVSGEVERHDAVCILPLNVVNEKIYIFLWFWFLLLGLVTVAVLIYRLVIILSPRMRVYVLKLRFRLVGKEALDAIVRRSKMGDWFLLYMLGDNIDSIVFRDVVHELAARLGSSSTKPSSISQA